MATRPDGRPLIGRLVRLDQASIDDLPDLFEALDHPEVYASGYADGARPGTWQEMASRLPGPEESRVCYVVRLARDCDFGAAGTVIGTTSVGDIDISRQRCQVGWTGYRPDVWGTAINPECKMVLLRHIFDDCGFERVQLQTDSINTRSQAAISKLGATREGVLRRHQPRADGTWRDTVVFSILRDEWPTVSSWLERRVAEADPNQR